MSSQWLYIAFYAVCALAVVLLLARYVRRRRAERLKADVTPSVETAATVEAAAEQEQSLATKPSAAARAAVGVSWGDRRLFVDFERSPDAGDVPPVQPDEVPTVDRSDYLFGAATPVLAAFLPESPERREVVKAELRTAGFYQPHAWQNLASVRYLGIFGPLVLGGVLLVLAPPRLEFFALLVMVIGSILGWALPRLYVRNRGRERVRDIENAVPDLLDLLNMCVSQGLTVQQALRRISVELRSVSPALSQELAIVSEQAEVGTLRQALENFSRRIDVPEVHSVTSLLIQTERMGTSISQALADHSDDMRESLRQRADEKANSAAFKLLFPTVTCLMPAVFIFLMGPAVVQISEFFQGGGREALDRGQQVIELIEQPLGQVDSAR